MPVPFTEKRALAYWQDQRDTYAPVIAQGVAALLPVDDIIEYVTRQIMRAIIAEAPAAWAWLHDALQRAGAEFDRRHTWKAIRNDKIRAFVEANDNPYDLLRKAISGLASEIEADIDAHKGARLLSMVGEADDDIASFFRKARTQRPDLSTVRETLPARQPGAERASLLRALAESEERADAAELRVADLTAELMHLKSLADQVIPASEQPDPAEEALAEHTTHSDTAPAVDLGAAAMGLPSLGAPPPLGEPASHEAPTPASLHTAAPLDAESTVRPMRRQRRTR